MSPTTAVSAKIRTLREQDLADADRIFRIAFGTFLGLPEPARFAEGHELIGNRWRSDPESVLAAEFDGRLIATNVATRWGSFGFFGPLTVLPEYWDRKVASLLLGPTMDLFEKWGTRHEGLYTFPHSAKHIALYQKFGFWPRFLTAILSKPVNGKAPASQSHRFSQLTSAQQDDCMKACFALTDSLLEGLDVRQEIRCVQTHALGDTVLLWDADRLDGFAVCHYGDGSEGGPNNCYVKFAAARDGASFTRLVDSIEDTAASRNLATIEAGVNLAQEDAYRRIRSQGFRTIGQGVAMQRPNREGYKRADVYSIDDWR